MDSVAEREAFKQRYWLRRDPTPGTPANEFADMVHERIRVANERFKFADTPGAWTARGFAFIVFGSPSRVSENPVPRTGAYPAARSTVPPRAPMGPNDGLESVVVWKYDRERTPEILKVVKRPTMEFTFYLEPERKRDRFEIEKTPRDLAQLVAEKTIVNPDMVPGGGSVTSAATSTLMPVVSPVSTLPGDANSALTSAASNERVHFGYATLLDERQLTGWFFVPNDVRLSNPRLVASVFDPNASNPAAEVLAQVTPTTELFASEGGRSYGVRLALPAPGSYSAQFALLDGSQPVATGSVPRLNVDPASFQISNIVLTGGVSGVSNPAGAFAFTDVEIMPRADNTFRFNESLWFFVQVANPASPEQLVAEVRLRRGNEPYGQPNRVPAQAGKIGEGLYLVGQEIPLLRFQPGDYSLYVTIFDGTNKQVSRADFTVLGPE
jgi:GWxTD domain-containing protein